jgi:hypothetical protein
MPKAAAVCLQAAAPAALAAAGERLALRGQQVCGEGRKQRARQGDLREDLRPGPGGCGCDDVVAVNNL